MHEIAELVAEHQAGGSMVGKGHHVAGRDRRARRRPRTVDLRLPSPSKGGQTEEF